MRPLPAVAAQVCLIDWRDITYHSIPNFLVGGFLGWAGSNALRWNNAEGIIITVLLAAGLIGILWYWFGRERAQHHGRLGGEQSHLEAYAPLLVGLAGAAIGFFVVSFMVSG